MNPTELPPPRYVVEDPKGNHRYRIRRPDGTTSERLKSVTGVLAVINKPALVNWAARVACEQIESRLRSLAATAPSVVLTDEWIAAVVAEGKKRPTAVKDEAADLGTAAHAAFEAIIANRVPDVPPAIRPAVDEFRRWLATSGTVIVAQEIPVGSDKHQFGGRLDALGWRPGKGFGILDWKTSNGIYAEYALQTAGGYALAVEEQYGLLIEWVDIARFPKKAPWGSEVVPVTDIATARRAFLSALSLGRDLDAPLLGEPTYSTFAENAAAVEATRENARATNGKATAKLGF